ncbi:LysE family translocator [Demequina aestuarii]|uniref:LysE family translocator n=1 Tax=Demequina aestuarii TaxID=327095 RepID=UPI00078073AC|nr:LysE family translocator [Demequina aestuarii]
MIAWDRLLAFVAVASVLVAIPGPSVLFIVGRALQHGRRGALLSVAGNAGGFVVHAVAVAAGVGALVAASATAFTVLKLAGGLYLVYLGVQAIRHRHDGLALPTAAEPPGDAVRDLDRLSTRRALSESFLVGVTNPKTLVFMVAVLPQFVDAARGPAWPQILVLGVVFALMALLIDSVWALAASGARRWVASSPRRVARVRAAGGGMMAALGVVLMASRRAAH